MAAHSDTATPPTAPPDVLGDLLGATFDFSALVLIFALFAALLVVALLELGVRRVINRRVYRAWWGEWQKRFMDRDGFSAIEHARAFDPKLSYTFSLPYRQFTAAFARNARKVLGENEERMRQAERDIDALQSTAQDDTSNAERLETLTQDLETMRVGEKQALEIDEDSFSLQQRLGHVWFRWNYALSLLMAYVIGALIYITPNKFDPGAGIVREVAYCGTHATAPEIVSQADKAACNPSEITIITTYLSSTMFLLLAICFCAALVAPIIVDQMERRLLLR